jgi:hypothetical protein
VRGEEDPVDEDAIELEVRLGLRLVEVVLGLADLLGVAVPVPRLERETAVLRVDHLLQVGGLAAGAGRRRRRQFGEEVVDRRRRLCHLILQLPGGVTGEAEEGRRLRAQLAETRDRRAGVVGIPFFGPRPRRREQPLPRVAVLERDQRRLLRRILQGDHPLAAEAARLRRLRRRVDLRRAQTGQRRRTVGDQRARFRRRQQLIGELRAQRRVFFVQLRERGLVGGRQLRAGEDEVLVIPLDEAERLGAELQLRPPLVDRLDAAKQLLVEKRRRLQRGQLRRFLFLDLFERVVVIGAGDAVEDELHARQQLAAALERLDGVLERGRHGIVGDLLDLLPLFLDASLERGPEILVADLVESRRVKRQGAPAQQRVHAFLATNEAQPGCDERGGEETEASDGRHPSILIDPYRPGGGSIRTRCARAAASRSCRAAGRTAPAWCRSRRRRRPSPDGDRSASRAR